MERTHAPTSGLRRRILAATAALLGLLMLLTACAGAPDGQTSPDVPEGPGAPDSADEGSAEGGQDSEGDLAGEGAAASGESERQVITTAHASLEVDDTPAAVEEVIARVQGHEGIVEGREERAREDGDGEHASLTVRVPAESFSELLDELDEIGEMVARSESAEDVTGAVRDLDARIDALETSTERLQGIMEEAESSEDLLQAETTLSERQADLEALEAERDGLTDQVAMSTLHLQLSTETLVESEPEGFLGGLKAGWDGLVSGIQLLLVILGAMLPTLLLLAALGVVVFVLVRRVLRGRRRRSAAARTPQEQPQDPQEQPQDPQEQPQDPAEQPQDPAQDERPRVTGRRQ